MLHILINDCSLYRSRYIEVKMTTALRSSLPSRLRQLLSREGAIGPSVKLDSEAVSYFIIICLSFSIDFLVCFTSWLGFYLN